MNKRLIVALAAAAATLPAAYAQDTGNWIVRARAVNLDSANKDQTGLGLDLSVNDKVIPEVDISYFFSPNLAAELILTYPQKHDIRAGGTTIGSLKHLPPTLTLQYHFTGMGSFRPYLGAGLNYTHFSSVEFIPAVAAANPSVKKNSTGFALQAGVDVPMGGGWLLNLDVKKVQIATKVYVDSAETETTTRVGGKFKVDPLLVGIGVGKRF